MTDDLFAAPPAAPAPPEPAVTIGPDGLVVCPHFTLEEHADWSYVPRTKANAKADATWALAVDFTTAGELLTAKAAGQKLLQTKVGRPSEEAARELVAHLQQLQARTLNVAGNGLYTLVQHFPSGKPEELQAKLDAYVLRVLTQVHAVWPLTQIRSGGQTGVDEAGVKAGIALGIPTLALLPHGYRMRNAIGDDQRMSRGAAWRRFVPTPRSPDVF